MPWDNLGESWLLGAAHTHSSAQLRSKSHRNARGVAARDRRGRGAMMVPRYGRYGTPSHPNTPHFTRDESWKYTLQHKIKAMERIRDMRPGEGGLSWE